MEVNGSANMGALPPPQRWQHPNQRTNATNLVKKQTADLHSLSRRRRTATLPPTKETCTTSNNSIHRRTNINNKIDPCPPLPPMTTT